MFIEDKDVKISEDRLNRSNFAKSLSLNIKNYLNRNEINDCLTIGLMGEWGSGKTSILNMTEEYLKDTDIKIIKFNPWLYSSYNQIVEQFFDNMIREFTDSHDDSLSNFVRQYKIKVNKLELAKKMTIASTSLINDRVSRFIESILGSSSQEENLLSIKKKIDKELKNHKIVCIIDDLDRLSKDEITEMFKLIKIMADFKNMVYLISFDKKVVSEALINDYSGEKYIEKIINVPLHIPIITKQELLDLILEEVNILKQRYKLDINYTRLNNYLIGYYEVQNKDFPIINFFKNIRDIKRFINILEFNIELIKDEVNFIDFFVLTSLQVFHLDIYNKIKYNEYLLTNHHYYDGIAIRKEKIIESNKEEFKKIFDNENIALILKKLFPMMEYIDHPNIYNLDFGYYDEQLFICHPNHFKAYFKLNDSAKKLPETEINNILTMINSKEPEEKIFENLKKMGADKTKLFLECMTDRLKKIVKKRYFIKILFLYNQKLEKDNYNLKNIKVLIIKLIYKSEKNCRFEILKENFKTSNDYKLLYSLWKEINKNKDNIKVNDEKILSKEEIDCLKNILVNRLNITEIKPWNISKFLDIIKTRKNLDLSKEVNDTIINNSIISNDNLLSLLKVFISEDKNYKYLNKEIIKMSEFCNIENIKNKIDKFYPEYTEEQVVKNFIEGYKQINNK